MPRITTFLMFNDKAPEAMDFYTSVFKNSKVTSAIPGSDGKPAGGSFLLDGQEFDAFNGGPSFSFAEGMSLFVHCGTQDEIDYYWERLSEGGEKQPCGWLKDKYGLSWQVTPRRLFELIRDPNRQKASAATNAMLHMGKIDVAQLEAAFDTA